MPLPLSIFLSISMVVVLALWLRSYQKFKAWDSPRRQKLNDEQANLLLHALYVARKNYEAQSRDEDNLTAREAIEDLEALSDLVEQCHDIELTFLEPTSRNDL